MYQWYKWQSQFHNLPEVNPKPKSYGQEYIAFNLFSETECFRDWIKSGRCHGNEHPCMSHDGYLSHLSNDYNLPLAQIKQWYDDPVYHNLTYKVANYEDVKIPQDILETFTTQARDVLKIQWDTALFTFSKQRPGDMFPLHRDRVKSADFYHQSQEKKLTRYLILIEDQKPGQILVMDDQPITWCAGDAITWAHQDFAYHGSANFGYWPKYTLRITAQMAD